MMVRVSIYAIAIFVSCVLPNIHASRNNLRHNEKHEAPFEKQETRRASEWMSCDEFFEYAASVTKAGGTRDPRTVPGYSRGPCRKAFNHIQKVPDFVDSIVNLGAHFEEKRRLKATQVFDPKDVVQDVASGLRLHRKLGEVGEDQCDQPLFGFGFGNPGPKSDTRAGPDPIGACVDPANDTCPHAPCVPLYLQANLSDSTQDTYEEKIPGYGGTGLYEFGTQFLVDPTGRAIWTLTLAL